MSENHILEKTLWQAADKLRSNMDAAEYKHVVLGLIFLKYISDAFDAIEHIFIEEIGPDWEKSVPDIKDICLSERVYYVPTTARWRYLLLTKRKGYLLFWTAFYIEENHTLRKKRKEYDIYIKTKTA
jgi:type I restriction-modification system DNA methylase subunit